MPHVTVQDNVVDINGDCFGFRANARTAVAPKDVVAFTTDDQVVIAALIIIALLIAAMIPPMISAR